jgi:hypothetical protein
METNPALPFAVNLWGSHPGDSNDDCWVGVEFATLAEARHAADNWREISRFDMSTTTHVQIDGPGVHEVLKVAEPRIDRRADDDRAWQREIAMEAGMGFGVNAYNDAMGWGE